MIELPFVNHGLGEIDLRTYCQRMPFRLALKSVHFKEDGAVNNTPSMAFVCRDPAGLSFVHELTVETLEGLLRQAGYRLTRLRVEPISQEVPP